MDAQIRKLEADKLELERQIAELRRQQANKPEEEGHFTRRARFAEAEALISSDPRISPAVSRGNVYGGAYRPGGSAIVAANALPPPPKVSPAFPATVDFSPSSSPDGMRNAAAASGKQQPSEEATAVEDRPSKSITEYAMTGRSNTARSTGADYSGHLTGSAATSGPRYSTARGIGHSTSARLRNLEDKYSDASARALRTFNEQAHGTHVGSYVQISARHRPKTIDPRTGGAHYNSPRFSTRRSQREYETQKQWVEERAREAKEEEAKKRAARKEAAQLNAFGQTGHLNRHVASKPSAAAKEKWKLLDPSNSNPNSARSQLSQGSARGRAGKPLLPAGRSCFEAVFLCLAPMLLPNAERLEHTTASSDSTAPPPPRSARGGAESLFPTVKAAGGGWTFFSNPKSARMHSPSQRALSARQEARALSPTTSARSTTGRSTSPKSARPTTPPKWKTPSPAGASKAARGGGGKTPPSASKAAPFSSPALTSAKNKKNFVPGSSRDPASSRPGSSRPQARGSKGRGASGRGSGRGAVKR